MKYEMYSTRDIVTNQFSAPYLAVNDASAIRSFNKDRASQPFPNDFELHLVGSFDSETGEISLKNLPHGESVLISDAAIQANAQEALIPSDPTEVKNG